MAGAVETSVITPSGIQIAYYPPPDRHYELRGGAGGSDYIGDRILQKKDYAFKTVPGVTEILDVLDKPLVWWGMEKGVEGVQGLLQKGYSVTNMSVKEVVAALGREKLTVNDLRNKGGDRGSIVHNAFETWATTGAKPDPQMYSLEEQGYVKGLCEFLHDVQPAPQESEVMVGSLEHSFAGRYDVRLRVDRPCEVVHKITPKKTYKSVLRPGVILCDLKTSAHVYPSHHLQIEAYEGASIESGYGASDHRGILRVSSDGRYEFVRSKSSFSHFLSVLDVYQALKQIK